MEKNFYTDDNFERLLREQTDRFTMQPTKKVWHSVYNDLHPARKWPSIAISLVLVISILMLGYFNTGNKTSPAMAGNTNKTGETATLSLSNSTITNKQVKEDASGSVADLNSAAPVFSQQTNPAAQPILQVPAATRPVATASLSTNSRISRHNTDASNTRPGTVASNIQTERRIATNTNTIINQPVMVSEAATGLTSSAAVSGALSPADELSNNKTLLPPASITATEKITGSIMSEQNKVAEKNIGADDNLRESGIERQTVVTIPQPASEIAAAKSKSNTALLKNAVTAAEDKAWMDDHAFYNKVNRGKWKNKLSWQVYATPSVSYRMLFNNTKSGENGSVVPNGPAMLLLRDKSIENSVTHKPGPGMEIGAGAVFAASKKWRIKAGAQLNYTSYQIFANEIAHPFSTSILLNNINTGNLDIESRFTSISNIPGGRNNRMTSYSYQLALPVGVDYKIRGNNTINWYAGFNVQPSFVLAGKSYLLSADRLAYVDAKENDKSLMRKFNLAFGAETFISYKKGNYTFMAGPRLRYQLLTTNNNAYTVGERAYSIGLSLGLQKNF